MENLRGSLLMVLAMAGFALEDMFVKALARGLPLGEVLAILGAGGAAIYAVVALLRRERLVTRGLLSGPVLMRNATELIGTMCFVSAVALTPLAQASAILQATPLAVTLGAALFLGETVGWRRWLAIGVGFAGVLIVIRPGTEGFSALSLLAVAAVIGLAARDVVTRRVPREVSSLMLATWGFASVIPAGVVMAALSPEPVRAPSPLEAAYFAGALVFGTGAYYALIAAMRIGEVSVITPFRYTRLVFALIIGAAIFAEPVDGATLAGGR
ncbi:DMT family transporter [Rhodobacter xanthinilyticus]|uniref:DMT family transporter n=1 Tax=Rhodobacter xanthinilyticus TaxID=1850250 RepID=UPI000AA7F652|nr:DMT family transporter [Rhodobacter xanthinilyticus]